MSRGLRIALAWIVVAASCGAIFYESSQSHVELPAIGLPFFEIDKWLHMGAYAVWAFLFSTAFRLTAPRLVPWAWLLISVLAGLVYGASDEFHQLYVPNRSCDIFDWAADGTGALLGTLAHAAWHYRPFLRRTPRPSPARAEGAGEADGR